MTTLEAKLRVSAETGQASGALRQLGKDSGALQSGLAPARKSLEELSKASEASAQRLRQTAQQMRLLAPQITDIVTGLATGQSPFTVLLQQGGQLRDVFGSFEAAGRALATVFTPLRLLMGGVAAGLGAVVYQAIQGARESEALQKNLALTGNAAGVTAAQIDGLARSLADANKASIGDSREAIAAVVASGRFSGAAIESTARAVLALGKLNGQTIEENLKAFTELADGVTAGAAKLNKQYNFLSVEQFKLIRTLEAQGRIQEAVRVGTDALAGTLEQRAAKAVGLYGRAWEGVKTTLSEVAESLKKIFRDATPEEFIADLQRRRDQLAGRIGSNPSETEREALAGADAALARARADRNRALIKQVDQAIAAGEVREEADGSTKAIEDAKTRLTVAAINQRLARTLAALGEQRAAIERSHAAELVSEQEYVERLNQIEVQRLRELRRTKAEELALESKKLVPNGVSAEQVAQRTRVADLKTQLIQLDAQISDTIAEGQTRSIAARVEQEQRAAQTFTDVWKRAADRVTQFAQAAEALRVQSIGDPEARAQAAADRATQPLRDELDKLQLQLRLQINLEIDPESARQLEVQLEALQQRFAAGIAAEDRLARFKELVDFASEAQARLAYQEEQIRARVQAGNIEEAAGTREILKLRRDQAAVLERIAVLTGKIAGTPAEKDQADRIKTDAEKLKLQLDEIAERLRKTAVDGLARGLTDIVTGAKTAKEALLDMTSSFLRAMLDVLSKRLAEKLVTQFEDAARGAGIGDLFGSIGSVLTSIFHSGGVVGDTTPRRSMPALAFALAPRYHSGGIAGLMPDEVPAVLRRGEEVLREDDPRHRRNGGGNVNTTVNVSVTASPGHDGEGAARGLGDVLGRAVKQTVVDVIADQMRPGGILAGR